MRSYCGWLARGALTLSVVSSASCGGGGSSSVSAPSATLTASPATVASGSSATLTWTSTNTTSCAASGGWSGALAASGSQSTGVLLSNATYVLTCTGPGGTGAPSSATVNVVPTTVLSASPLVVAAGSTSTLTWSAANATGCTASGGWSGAKSPSGSAQTAVLAITTTYSLACSGAGGPSVPASVTVAVVPTAVLTATPTTVAAGGTATLNWSSSNATACTASGAWSGAKAPSGSQSTGALSAPATYSLTCSGAGGNSNTSSVTILSGRVSITPALAALTAAQTQLFTATVPGGGAATWTVDGIAGGNGTVGTISTSGRYKPGTTAGSHTVAATSVAYPALSGTAVAAVTALGGVYTYHDDLARDGANSQEFALSPSTVSATSFGKLFACPVDGAIYAQPLWVANLVVNGAHHNVVFVATAHDSVYAFDADTSPCTPLWTASLIDTAHGASSGETPVPDAPTDYLVGHGEGDMAPEVGVSGTPVIDPISGNLYVVAKSVDASHTTFYQRLHALDLATGNERSAAPVVIAATYPGIGDGGTTVTFNPGPENQRPALALVNGVVYIAWSAHEDVAPWYGWVMGYSYGASGFTQVDVFNAAPDAQQAGIWMSGGAPAADSAGNLYLVTGNGAFDVTGRTAPNSDYGNTLLELTPALAVSQYFTPSDQATDTAGDRDFGAGGAAVLANLPAGSPVTQLLLCGGKDGTLYALNRDNLGGFGDSAAVQKIAFGYPVYATGAYWNSNYFIVGDGGSLADFVVTATVPEMTLSAASIHQYGFGGSSPSVSAAGTQNGVVWTLDNTNYCIGHATTCGPSVLYAHDASDIATELWNSGAAAADAAGNAVKFTVPTVANGKVYVGTRGNNTGGAAGSTTVAGELDVYGLLP